MNKNRDILSVVLATAAILLIPLVAMQFTEEVAWTLSDFVIAAILLLGTGLIYVFAARHIRNSKYKMAIGIALALVLVLVWAELAVGLFGTPWAGS